MDINTNGIKVQVPATLTNAWNGGLHAYRDASQLTGGTPGYVNSANVTEVITGKTVSWEYAGLDLLTNNADAGENCARYCKAVKKGAGATWAVCHEVNDPDNHPGSMVPEENDIWCNGPDNGLRIGSDNVIGDAKVINGQTAQPSVSEGTAAFRATACSATPWSRWSAAFWAAKSYKEHGLLLEAPDEGAVRGAWIKGKHVVGIDLADLKCSGGAIRLPKGGRITCEPTDQVGFGYNPDTQSFEISIGKTVLLSVNLDGTVRVPGKLVLNGKQL